MKIFLDTMDIEAILELSEYGLVDGVTTNPSLVASSGKNLEETIKEMCKINALSSISVEVIATDYDGMMKEASKIIDYGSQVTIKLPMTRDGLRACKALSEEGHMVNMTLIFSPGQAIAAAKAGAAFISPFVGRLDDCCSDGMSLIKKIYDILVNYPEYDTEILVASIRSVDQIIKSAKIGADVVTAKPEVVKKLIDHPLTEKGLQIFLNDWDEAFGQKH